MSTETQEVSGPTPELAAIMDKACDALEAAGVPTVQVPHVLMGFALAMIETNRCPEHRVEELADVRDILEEKLEDARNAAQ